MYRRYVYNVYESILTEGTGNFRPLKKEGKKEEKRSKTRTENGRARIIPFREKHGIHEFGARLGRTNLQSNSVSGDIFRSSGCTLAEASTKNIRQTHVGEIN